jgi:hypothetical protein
MGRTNSLLAWRDAPIVIFLNRLAVCAIVASEISLPEEGEQ